VLLFGGGSDKLQSDFEPVDPANCGKWHVERCLQVRQEYSKLDIFVGKQRLGTLKETARKRDIEKAALPDGVIPRKHDRTFD
jgi:hypothetical protein